MKIRQAVSLVMLAFVIQACASTTQGPHSRATTNQSLLTPPPVSEFASAESVNEEAPKATPKRPPLPSLTGTIQSGLMGFNPQTKGAKPTFPEKDKQKISFLFEKVDVSEVTSQIFGDYLKLNYVLDPTLQGRISFYLEGEFSKEDLFQMITRAYAANNISVVPRNGVYYIQPLQRSASSSLPLASEFTLKTAAGGAQPVIVIYRLLYMDVKQAINTIKFFLTPGRPITSDSMTNSVIFVDDTDNARTIVDILKSLDINILQEVSMEIIPLQAITAQDAVQGMESLLGKLNLVKESSIKNNIAFIPLQNFGGVLVLAQSAELLRTAKYWLTALDVHSQESGEQIYVYFVKNGLAGDLASILTQAYGLEAPSGGGRLDQQVVQSGRPFGSSSGRSSFGSGTSGFGGSSFGGSSSSSRSGGYGTSGSSLSGGGFGSSSSSMGTTGSSKPSTSSSQSRSGDRGNVRSTGTYTRVSEGDASGTSLTGDVAIIPDEVNNAIVIRSNAADYARIKKTMETLDILPRAVLIEVLIAEVALNKNIEYGLEWFFKDIGMDIAGKDGKFTAAHGVADSTALAAAASGGLNLFWGSVDGKIAALISLLASKTDVNVLSTPTLLATDNKEASIQVGGREPVPTGSFSSDTGTNNAFTTIQYEETGVILNVTPHINEGGLVRLEVEQTIRRTDPNAVTVGANNTAPRFTERNVKTTLLAQNGCTVVIGGIIEQVDNDSKSGIPFLQDIPIISPLFSTKSKSKARTELIIAITPHVVDHRETGGSSREFLDQLKKLRRQIGG